MRVHSSTTKAAAINAEAPGPRRDDRTQEYRQHTQRNHRNGTHEDTKEQQNPQGNFKSRQSRS